MGNAADPSGSAADASVDSSIPSASAPAANPLSHPVPHRIPSLDGIRALAILMVLLGHFSAGTPIPMPYGYLWPMVGNGSLGVTIFFVISGFLITRLLMREREKTGRISLKDFYIRRAFRILPAFLTFIGFIVVLKLTGVLNVSVANIMSGVLFIMNYSSANNRWELAHLWSLSVEEQFYLVWPLMMILLGNRRAMHAGIIIIAVSPLVRLAQYAFFPSTRILIGIMGHTRLDSMMYGCVAALALDQIWFKQTYKRIVQWQLHWILPLFVSCIAPYTLNRLGGAYALPVGHSLESFAWAIAMLWLIQHPHSRVGRIFNAGFVTWIGVLSYSLYLWHPPFFAPEPMAWPATFWYNIPIVIALAMASYYLIEQPFLRLRVKLMASRRE